MRRLRTIRRSQREAVARAKKLPASAGLDSVAALRAQADQMLMADLDAVIGDASRGYVLAGTTAVPAVVAASATSRSVVYVVPGFGAGAAIRLEAPETGRELCESITLPDLGLDAVRAQGKKVREVLASDERRIRVRNQAVQEAHEAVGAAVWGPVLDAWPELGGGRVALIPLGESALLPLYTAPVDGTPACGLMDLTVVPSGDALMFAGAWPRPATRDPLIVADPWYDDGEGGRPIPFTVPEARTVAAIHGVEPVILREPEQASEEGEGDRLRTTVGPARPVPPSGEAPHDLAHRITAANLVHLAGHGTLDAHEPLRSAILLGRPLPLSALLEHDIQRGTTVVLSACHLAGIGTHLPGEQLGFPAAMLAMGASSVIAALWSMPDSEQTVALMSWLHEELSGEASPSVALGRAVTRAMAEGIPATVWGPFTHFGA
ncbi:CHAT domain-containing protein [Streptomyces sp. SLBN-118]|uniref:CHAT domain-containing protein n=1 Tax=Streptomyces sp. SLBN-118 TaxID=2768454 RepID=UPI001150CF0F|nr:CHAT domain-containing protein [Streptomyces sp. SLBN-118]TQK50174.1 CHAT domain-containing protein [Streptomyces sp. SLBN-118]